MSKTVAQKTCKDTGIEIPEATENQVLRDRIAVLEAELEGQRVEAERWKLLYLSSRQRLYGKKSEVSQAEHLDLFDEAELENTCDVLEHSEAQVTAQSVRTYTRRANRNRTLTVGPDTPVVEIEHPCATPVCPCGSAMERTGSFSRDAIAVIPATKVVVRHLYPQYRCANCLGDEGENQTITPSTDPSLLKGSICEPSLLSTIVTDKMGYGLPLYRQQQRFASLGVDLSRQAMSGWMMGAAQALAPLKAALERRIGDCALWNMDETSLQVLRVPGEQEARDCFMAVRVGTDGDGKAAVVLFDFLENRTNASIASLIGGFGGVVQSDGLGGYAAAARQGNFTHIGCHVHARRKFADILKVQKSHKLASEAIGLYATFFHHERELIEGRRAETPVGEEEYLVRRRAVLGADLEAIHDWLLAYQKAAIPKTPLLGAINYALGRWEELNRFLDHPYATSSNNTAENAIRPFVLARKGFLFANTPQGARASALYFSLTETCKAMGIDAHRYLTHLFANAGNCQTETDWDAMLPGSADLGDVDDHFAALRGARLDPDRTKPYILRGKRY